MKKQCAKQVEDLQYHLAHQSPDESATHQSLQEHLTKMNNDRLMSKVMPDLFYVEEQHLNQWKNGHNIVELRRRCVLDTQQHGMMSVRNPSPRNSLGTQQSVTHSKGESVTSGYLAGRRWCLHYGNEPEREQEQE